MTANSVQVKTVAEQADELFAADSTCASSCCISQQPGGCLSSTWHCSWNLNQPDRISTLSNAAHIVNTAFRSVWTASDWQHPLPMHQPVRDADLPQPVLQFLVMGCSCWQPCMCAGTASQDAHLKVWCKQILLHNLQEEEMLVQSS